MIQTPHVSAIDNAILKTLIYGDIFDFPLTYEEIHKYLISRKSVDKKLLKQCIDQLVNIKLIGKMKELYFLKGQETLIDLRSRRRVESKKKIDLLKPIVSLLSVVPSISFIGISGNLAMQNADENDDIDLFVICQKNRIWITRLFVLIILQILGKRRRRNEKDAKNKICVNMFVDERDLVLPSNKRDLYNAHETVQMVPVFDRKNTYQRFLKENEWVREFLPNSIDIKILRYKDTERTDSPNISKSLPADRQGQYLNILELLAKKLQLWYMKQYRTRETISDTLLAFHPIDYRKKTLSMYNKKVTEFMESVVLK